MSETLQEYVDSRGVTMRVDRERGVIRGVKVLGLRSRNGREYLPEALEKAVGLYEGARVNVNHPKASPTAARDYQDRMGSLRDVVVRADEGLFADLHFNPKHVLAEQLVWDAQHAPRNVGLSHNVLARTARRGDRTVVEAIVRVQSVDLVADPATTDGLFEAAGGDGEDWAADEPAEEPALEQTVELVRLREELSRAEAEVARLRESESQMQRLLLVCRLVGEADLPEGVTERVDTFISKRFLVTLLAAPDEETVRELIRDRARLVERLMSNTAKPGRPRSREQIAIDGARASDSGAFVRAIT